MLKKFFILGLLSAQAFCASQALDDYFLTLEKLDQPKGSYKEGEIEIITDPAEMARIQKVQEGRLLKKGFSEAQAAEFSRVGVISEDTYWIWLRDAVKFPQGILGTYGRLITKSRGVAVLPILPSGKIALVLTYRHATRSWELELPRGGVDRKESFEEAALRELKEETGLIGTLSSLGSVVTDSGIVSPEVPVYAAKISEEGQPSREFSEAIDDVLTFTVEEIKQGLVQGSLEVTVQGKKKRAALRDAFLTFALLQAELRQLI